MFSTIKKSCQDIAFFHIEKPAPPPKKSHPLAMAAAGVIVAVILIGAGYCAGWRAGYFAAPCCIGGYDFDFDLDL
ncbi:hypothetical protein [Hyphococcus luteus]|uniref:Uncharacterized protein n=1 Tax=Hyphococcus luteus TaxID=2058213 RepID=A0A2S7JZJ0_9PROT|nr:hypothetical protein [Marinicaulis flavus]PQA85618.1 hypothetical protein CW354_22045 [Marinicaulis flavus]